MNFASGRHHAIVNFDSRYQKPRDDDDLADVTITVTNDTNSSESVTYPLPPLAPEVVVIDGPGP
jgi:hypothetical protein